MRPISQCRPIAGSPIRLWQTLRAPAAILLPLVCWIMFSEPAAWAQIYDPLDVYPPRWRLASSDCDARVISQGHLADGGLGGHACETIQFVAGHGTEVILAYPIEPVQPLDDLTANVSVMSARSGARIGVRVRFPYLRDEATGRPVAVIVYGAGYDSPGEFASIGVGMIERPLRMKLVALRRQYGAAADVNDPYVDAIVINAYSGPGTTALRIDELRVDGLVPVGESVLTGNVPAADSTTTRPGRTGSARSLGPTTDDRGTGNQANRVSMDDPRAGVSMSPFPISRLTRILQHNGEPLSWVRSLGFDAVLLSEPPDAAILSEAIQSQIAVYAPPPSSPDPTIEALLEPVLAWYLGSHTALDIRHVDQTALTAERLRRWPTRWQRPLIAAPSEAWQGYAPYLDAIINDLPPRVRGLPGGEEVDEMVQARRRFGNRLPIAVGVVSMPPETLLQQCETIADRVGAPRPEGFHWHAMWLQAMRSLESNPAAILFRSTRSLADGDPLSNERALALSYVNRMIAMIAPWAVDASPAPPPTIVGAPYRCTRLTFQGTDLLVLTSTASRGSETLSGDGQTLQIRLLVSDAGRTIWRMTHFSAQRIHPETDSTGPFLEVVSPDVCEIIVLSNDPREGVRLSLAAQRFARQASLDRWQLADDLVRRTREGWQTATAMQALQRETPTNLIDVAERTLVEAEPLYRSGDTDASLRMARRADAWALRSQWQLIESLMPDWPRPTSCPPIAIGAPRIQTFWRPLMNSDGWSKNLLNSGSLDSPDLLAPGRWTLGRRSASRATSDVMFVTRGTFSGPGALRARVTPIGDEPLPGGYEGTVVQIRSPAVRVGQGKAVRIDAWVRTIGFTGPHQGLLVYDTVGGQELGVLIRGRPEWTPVRLYRQVDGETEVHAMFEVIGAGEATIDQVQVKVWQPQMPIQSRMSPIASRPDRPQPDRGQSNRGRNEPMSESSTGAVESSRR